MSSYFSKNVGGRWEIIEVNDKKVAEIGDENFKKNKKILDYIKKNMSSIYEGGLIVVESGKPTLDKKGNINLSKCKWRIEYTRESKEGYTQGERLALYSTSARHAHYAEENSLMQELYKQQEKEKAE